MKKIRIIIIVCTVEVKGIFDKTLSKLEKLCNRKLQTSIKNFDFTTNLDIVCGFPKNMFCVKSNVKNLISVGYQIRP